jgi:hypothetical protein
MIRDTVGHIAFKVFLWSLNIKDEQQYQRILEIQIDEDRKELAEEGRAGDPGELADEMYEEDLKALKRLRFWQSHNKDSWLDPRLELHNPLVLDIETTERTRALDEFDNALNALSLAALGKTTKQNHEDRRRNNV